MKQYIISFMMLFVCMVTNASVDLRVSYEDSLLTETITGSLDAGGTGYFDSGVSGGTGTAVKSLNTTTVKAGTYSCQSTATVTENGVTHFSFTKVLPYNARFKFANIETMVFYFKMLTADTDWICQIAWLKDDYTLVAQYLVPYRNGNYTHFWDNGMWDYQEQKNSENFTLFSDSSEVAQVRFTMQYVGNATGQVNQILLDHMYIIFSPDTVLTETIAGGLNEGDTGYFDSGVTGGSGTATKSLESTDKVAGAYSCKSTANVTGTGETHFTFTKILPYDCRFNLEDLETMSFNFKMMTEDTDWLCEVSWLTSDYKLLARYSISSQNGNFETFWGEGNEWYYEDWKDDESFTIFSDVEEVAQIRFDMCYVGDGNGQQNTILVDNMDIVYSKPFRVGWWDDLVWHRLDEVEPMAATSTGIAVCYDRTDGDIATVEDWLDEAFLVGQKLVVGIPSAYVLAKDTTAIQNFVNALDDHPAVFGWDTYDEPASDKADECETAYAAIKAVSNKPVFLGFCTNNSMSDFTNAYDIALFDSYPCVQGEAEFAGFEDEYFLWWKTSDGWKTIITNASNDSVAVGKPWWSIIQALGRQPDNLYNFRLPTKKEYRFMVYYSFLKNAESVINWIYYLTMLSVANSSDPYPYNGESWIEDVVSPLSTELSVCGNALRAGVIPGVADNQTDVHAFAYRDPFNGKTFILALNDTNSSKNVTYTVWLGSNLTQADPLDEGDTRTISNGQFTDTLSAYEVIIYELKE